MKRNPFIIIRKEPKVVVLKDNGEVFGEIREILSVEGGAKRTNLAQVTLKGPDILHSHRKAEETYICVEGEGYIFLNGEIYDFGLGTRIIIKPGTLHAASPKNDSEKLVFLCISSPAFDPDDVFEDPCRRVWQTAQ